MRKRSVVVKVFLGVKSFDQSCVSSYPVNSVLKREKSAISPLHLSEFILSSFDLLPNLRNDKF